MNHELTTEDLVRYVDGELTAEEVRRVELASATDPSVRKTIRDLSESTALLRAAFSESPDSETLELLKRAVEASVSAGQIIARGSVRHPVRHMPRWFVPAAVAAGIAVVALSLGGGYFVAGARLDGELARVEAQHAEDRLAFQNAVQRALEEHVSGTTVRWQSPGSGKGGTVIPVRTFRSENGQWCREYAHSVEVGGRLETRHAVACRERDGMWTTRIPTFVDS